jgi:hypothetical protein
MVNDMNTQIINTLRSLACKIYGPKSNTPSHPPQNQNHLSPTIESSIHQAKSATFSAKPSPISSPQLLNQARSTFRNLFRSTNPVYDPPDHPFDSSYPHDLGNFRFATKESIFNAIEEYPSHKTAGPDGVSINLLKEIRWATDITEALAEFFQFCFIEGTVPVQWNAFTTVLIPKPDTPVNPTLLDLRPIGIGNIIRSLYEKHLLSHLAKRAPIQPL